MIVIVQSEAFDNLLRQLEGDPNIHTDTLNLNFRRYTDRLWEHLRPYGVNFEGVTGQHNSLWGLQFRLQGHPTHADTVLEGIGVLQPVSVGVQLRDLDVLIGLPMTRAMFADNWATLQHELANVDFHGLRQRLEDVAMRLLSAPRQIQANDEPEETLLGSEEQFRLWCASNNLPIPNAANVNRERQEQRANEERQQRHREAIEKQFDQPESTSFGWREL